MHTLIVLYSIFLLNFVTLDLLASKKSIVPEKSSIKISLQELSDLLTKAPEEPEDGKGIWKLLHYQKLMSFIAADTVRARDEKGRTLLMLACISHFKPITCKLLLDLGIDSDISDKKNRSALDYLIWNYRTCNDSHEKVDFRAIDFLAKDFSIKTLTVSLAYANFYSKDSNAQYYKLFPEYNNKNLHLPIDERNKNCSRHLASIAQHIKQILDKRIEEQNLRDAHHPYPKRLYITQFLH